jgi:hypothetical protein
MACSCGNSACDCLDITLPSGDTGAAGAAGTNGEPGGWSLEWKFDTNTTTNPATGDVRLNNAIFDNVTEFYIHDYNTDFVNATAFLEALGNSGSGGVIKIFKRDADENFIMGYATASTDSGGTYWTVSFTHVLSNGSFTNNDVLVITFSPNGAAGTVNSGFMIDLKQGTYDLPSTANLGVLQTPLLNGNPLEIDISGPDIMERVGDTLRIRTEWIHSLPQAQFFGTTKLNSAAVYLVNTSGLTDVEVPVFTATNLLPEGEMRNLYVADIELYRLSSTKVGVISKLEFLWSNYTAGTGGDIEVLSRYPFKFEWCTDGFATVTHWNDMDTLRVKLTANAPGDYSQVKGKLLYAEFIKCFKL